MFTYHESRRQRKQQQEKKEREIESSREKGGHTKVEKSMNPRNSTQTTAKKGQNHNIKYTAMLLYGD